MSDLFQEPNALGLVNLVDGKVGNYRLPIVPGRITAFLCNFQKEETSCQAIQCIESTKCIIQITAHLKFLNGTQSFD